MCATANETQIPDLDLNRRNMISYARTLTVFYLWFSSPGYSYRCAVRKTEEVRKLAEAIKNLSISKHEEPKVVEHSGSVHRLIMDLEDGVVTVRHRCVFEDPYDNHEKWRVQVEYERLLQLAQEFSLF